MARNLEKGDGVQFKSISVTLSNYSVNVSSTALNDCFLHIVHRSNRGMVLNNIPIKIFTYTERGKGFPFRLLEALLVHAQEAGCYKVILDCSDQNVAFYEKCGFERKEVQMVHFCWTPSIANSMSSLSLFPIFLGALCFPNLLDNCNLHPLKTSQQLERSLMNAAHAGQVLPLMKKEAPAQE